MSTPDAGSAEPLLTVVRGTPTDEELAALVTVLAALPAAAAEPAAVERPSGWVDRSRALRPLPTPGPGAWLGSARA